MIKISGKELKEFYNDDAFWPTGIYHQDELIRLPDGSTLQESAVYDDDIDALPDDIMVEVEGGDVEDPRVGKRIDSFENYLLRWQLEQAHQKFVIMLPKDPELFEKLKAFVEPLGGSIL